jgi:hypothetical protein
MQNINELSTGSTDQKESTRRYKYIHIWSSNEEIRVLSTDVQILQVFARAIERSDPDCEIDNRRDLSDEVHIVQVTEMDPPERYRKVAWWLFKMLCERGWEPMATGENWYKMKFYD